MWAKQRSGYLALVEVVRPGSAQGSGTAELGEGPGMEEGLGPAGLGAVALPGDTRTVPAACEGCTCLNPLGAKPTSLLSSHFHTLHHNSLQAWVLLSCLQDTIPESSGWLSCLERVSLGKLYEQGRSGFLWQESRAIGSEGLPGWWCQMELEGARHQVARKVLPHPHGLLGI